MIQPESSVLKEFHRFIGQKLESDAANGMSPEDVLAQWREQEDVIAAIREGLADVKAGRTKSLDEFDQEFRSRHGI